MTTVRACHTPYSVDQSRQAGKLTLYRIRVSLRMVILIIVLLGSPNVFSQEDDASSRETLKGLSAVGVAFLISSCQRVGFHEAELRTDVELQLRMAGIKVLPSGPPVTLRVVLISYVFDDNVQGYSYTQKIDIVQWIPWPHERSGKDARVITWESRIAVGVHYENNAPMVKTPSIVA